MRHLDWIARDRLYKFRDQLNQVKCAEFSNKSTLDAIKCIESEIIRLEKEIDRLSSLKKVSYLLQHVVVINHKLVSLSNALGILLRSTNLRNSFEAYFSFNQIAERVIGSNNCLIISSEWESVPFYIPSPPEALAAFVIIGIPAFASRNALLLPLASHELGHAIWRLKKIDTQISPRSQQLFKQYIDENPDKFKNDFGLRENLFADAEADVIKSECLKLVSSQCEEMFCDFFGSVLFGESFLYAFDAFLSPGFGHREPRYPSLSHRAAYIKKAALNNPNSLRKEVLDPSYFQFADGNLKRTPIVVLADKLSEAMEEAILNEAMRYANEARFELDGGESCDTMMTNLRIGIPPNRPRSIVDILNAIWKVYFEKLDQASDNDVRISIHALMNNLCLKSLEIYEFRYRNQFG